MNDKFELDYDEAKELLAFIVPHYISHEIGPAYNGEVVHEVVNKLQRFVDGKDDNLPALHE